MLRLSFCLCIAVGLSACATTATLEQSAGLNRAIDRAMALPEDQRTIVDGAVFDVERLSPTQARVANVNGAHANITDVETAAQLATGCAAKADPAVYARMGQNTSYGISREAALDFDFLLPVTLTCPR